MLRAFRQAGVTHEVVVARDGAAALERLLPAGREPVLPALVLLDLKLPRVDGFEVLRRLRADGRTRLVPVVVLSASGEAEDVARSLECGANAYVRKPVDFARFVRAAGAIAGFWLDCSEPVPGRQDGMA
jgi:two-component system response regulator